jgi:hypothetical protein
MSTINHFHDDKHYNIPGRSYSVTEWKTILDNLNTLEVSELHTGILKFSTDFIPARENATEK